MVTYQIPLPIYSVRTDSNRPNRQKLTDLLSQDLDFHDWGSSYASHNFHSFPAKFPPQLPRKFIEALTDPGDIVLDPMAGSSTTIVEAYLTHRHAIGFDIDPLALTISQVKVTPLDLEQTIRLGNAILKQATTSVRERQDELEQRLKQRWDPATRKFVNYWFAPETQIELLALVSEIEKITDPPLRAFFELAFSAIIITKSGGVSLALDLAHTRPHRAKIVKSKSGEVIIESDTTGSSPRRIEFLTRILRSPLEEFEKRLRKNLESLIGLNVTRTNPHIVLGNAQSLPLNNDCVDLIITSPPYASNAIDYMRAHKFSLVWMGHSINKLSQKRKEYIGGESITDIDFEELPERTAAVVAKIARRDKKKSRVLHRYYSEMTRTLREMFRVLRPDKTAIVVVGTSTMRGEDTETQNCLAEIGQTLGFEVPKIGVRYLDRDRRMMPAGLQVDLDSQIQQRMHEEYVIGFYKPETNATAFTPVPAYAMPTPTTAPTSPPRPPPRSATAIPAL